MVIDEDIPRTRRTIEQITTKCNIYFFLALALLGGFTFIGGLIQLSACDSKVLDDVPEPIMEMGIGMVTFALFFPWFTAIYFARHFLATVKQLERENEELRAKTALLLKTPCDRQS